MNKIKNQIALSVFLACNIVFAPLVVARAQEYKYTADHAKLIFGVSANAQEPIILAFVSKESEGEDVSGTPTIVNLKTLKVTTLRKVDTMAGDASAYWRSNNSVVFESLGGIYEVDPAEERPIPKNLVLGRTHGLAFSKSGSRMAYWKKMAGTLDLIVCEVATHRTLRTWKLPLVYGGDATGFEIAFRGEDEIFARTFDRADSTPLKRFDIQSGKSQTVVRDCFSLVADEKIVYFIENRGHSQFINRMVDASVTPVTNAKYYLTMRTSSGRRIALEGPHGSGLLDVDTGQIIHETNCDEEVVLAGGVVGYVKGNSLSTSAALCDRPRSPSTMRPK